MPSRTRQTMSPEEEERWAEEMARAREELRNGPRHDWRKLTDRYLRRYAIDGVIPYGMLYRIERRYGRNAGSISQHYNPVYRKVNALEWGNIVARYYRHRTSTDRPLLIP